MVAWFFHPSEQYPLISVNTCHGICLTQPSSTFLHKSLIHPPFLFPPFLCLMFKHDSCFTKYDSFCHFIGVLHPVSFGAFSDVGRFSLTMLVFFFFSLLCPLFLVSHSFPCWVFHHAVFLVFTKRIIIKNSLLCNLNWD